MADVSPSDIFVARQPIFDAQSKLFGYELLFRSSWENQVDLSDPELASASVMANSFFVFGIGSLTGTTRAFINFTRASLFRDFALALPPDSLVVEILEDVKPDSDVVAACARLKQAGYLIALDDFDQRDEVGDLLDFADIVKIDFEACDERQRTAFARDLGHRGVALLAEKVETREDSDQAVRLGYSYLQGYFFAQPEILVRQQAPALKATRLQIIQELHRPDPNLRIVEDLFKHDPDLAYKLLRHLNSPAFGFRSRIRTIWHAFTMLGESGMRAWASVIILAGLGSEKPSELVVTSVARARFCQLIGAELRMKDQSDDLFLMGLFSLIDAITSRPLQEALDALPLSDSACGALLGEPNRLRQVLDLVKLYERGQWAAADQLSSSIGLRRSDVPALYRAALAWGDQSRALS